MRVRIFVIIHLLGREKDNKEINLIQTKFIWMLEFREKDSQNDKILYPQKNQILTLGIKFSSSDCEKL